MRSYTLPIFALALLCLAYQVSHPTDFGFGAGWEPVAIARELAQRGAYANPFQAGTSGPTAVIPPLYPVYLAALIKLLGDTPAFGFAATVAVVLVQALQTALLPGVSQRFFGDAGPGVVAGFLSAFAFRLMPQWDTTFTTCGVLLFVLRAESTSWRTVLLSGVAAGVLVLSNPSTILITGPWMVYLCAERTAGLVRIAGFAAAVFMTVLPWMVRNEVVLGTFALKDNLGMSAFASNNDCAHASLAANMANGCTDAMNPNTSARELQALNRMGEAHYDAVRMTDTVHWVREHAGTFTRLTEERILQFWFPPLEPPRYTAVAVWVVTALSIPGIFLLIRRRAPVAWYIVAVTLIYPVLYYVIVSGVRYRYPILWISLLCTGYLLHIPTNVRRLPTPACASAEKL